ncbi:rhamnogalacturonan lyase [Bacteroidia bacterium]|nr:rhamnogalacturonan lyase [Bacteroidia bacterium]
MNDKKQINHMKNKIVLIIVLLSFFHGFISAQGPKYSADIQKENLGRGLVAYRATSTSVVVTWRYLETDALDLGFNVYKGTTKLNASPITKNTFYKYSESGTGALTYSIKTVENGEESADAVATYTLKSTADGGGNPYIEIPMKQIDGDASWTYAPNDASFADLDGDGEMEIVIHRVGPNSKDNSQSGTTEPPVFQAYKLDGTFMWEINLGINVRDGAHYTQFMLYDLDGDGKAELVMKTAEGGTDALGNNIGEAYFPTYKAKYKLTANYNANADYRNGNGYILQGPEFLTVFNGETGVEIVTTEYDPPRYSTSYNGGNEVPKLVPTANEINSRWGDNYGNRVDRFIACVAYLDGIHPSVIMQRGYYSRTVLVAYDFKDGQLTKRWKFDTYNTTTANAAYAGQGNHNVRVADVDGDGMDEIICGSMAIDDDGTGLYNTKLGHGDAMHLTDFVPERPGLELLAVHENKVDGTTLRDAATGEILWQVPSGDDVGRGMGTDISAAFRGMEFWSSRSGGIFNFTPTNGAKTVSSSTNGVSMNMACWWDGDLLRELQDGTSVTKWNNGSATNLLSPSGVASNNGTKANPCIVGDILGDWREEVVLRTTNNRFIRIYMTPTATDYRFHTFLQDPVYRMSIVYQNVSYNQPTHTGFYFGSDLENIFVATRIDSIAEAEYVIDPIFEAIAYQWSADGSVIASTDKKLVLKQADYADGAEHKIKLDMNYHGQVFSDSITITFAYVPPVDPTDPTDIAWVETGTPVKLLSTVVKNDLIVQFENSGIYNVSVYNMTGSVVAKTALVVGGKSTHTFSVDDLASGQYVVVIENGSTAHREKCLKF